MTLRLFSICCLWLTLCLDTEAQTVIVCGRELVSVLSIDQTHEQAKGHEQAKWQVQWQWDARRCDQLPESLRPAFATTDECKPDAQGSRLLITSSSGGCAVVEYPRGKAIWYAQVPNAHSIEMLPDERVVVASSVNARGNKLVMFDLAKPNQAIAEAPLESAHGVVWDDKRQRLWALGLDQLQSYVIDQTLQLERTFKLPTSGGHDLIALPDSDDLVVSTEFGVYRFDRTQLRFRVDPELGDWPHVKSVAFDNVTKRWAVIQADEDRWWSNEIRWLTPSQTMKMPEQDLYKLRFMPER